MGLAFRRGVTLFGARWFIIDGDGLLKKVPFRNFQKFIDGDYAFPDQQGPRLKSAYLILDLKDRKPVAVRRAEFTQLALAPGGFYKTDSYIEEAVLIRRQDGNRFTKNYIANTIRWKPTQEQMSQILESIFKSKSKPKRKSPKRKLRLVKPK